MRRHLGVGMAFRGRVEGAVAPRERPPGALPAASPVWLLEKAAEAACGVLYKPRQNFIYLSAELSRLYGQRNSVNVNTRFLKRSRRQFASARHGGSSSKYTEGEPS
jgi:hypothetical protein